MTAGGIRRAARRCGFREWDELQFDGGHYGFVFQRDGVYMSIEMAGETVVGIWYDTGIGADCALTDTPDQFAELAEAIAQHVRRCKK